ncbi:MAG: hypothetical protein HYU37_13500 [Acidobacteria bacterium]|nr:hypothetical protein [Acidobacteriota bacterium]
MFLLTLALHSLLRWVVLIAGAVAVARSVTAWRSRTAWTAGDDYAGWWFVIALDAQLLLGLVLYLWLSPMTQIAFQNFGAAMGNAVLRFWAVEHISGMVVALALAHVGRVRIRRAAAAASRHRTAAIFFGLALLAIVLTVPWPGMPAARPLFRIP